MIVAVVVSLLLVAIGWAAVFVLALPLWIAIAISVAVVLAWAGSLLWRFWKARKAAGAIEQELKSQAAAQAHSARPDQQEEIEAMQREFTTAVQALKSSKLARGGRNALAVLPWYLIIGPPGSGKSTALRASGLKFPYLSKRGGVRGVGGTRNCEWWLTNEAVLLDTAGRYTTEEEDHEEWTSFLDLLARTRPRHPIDGLVVAVSISDAGADSGDESAAELGRRMRERVDEVMTRLQMVLPVYVVFTKCDLLPGFVETFADLRKADRGQVWGFTLPVGEAGDKGEIFRERFDELLGVIEERSLRRLADERHVAARERIYEFPQQLDAVRTPLASFVDALFAENVYQDSPILRGVYFTSGTQEGRPIDRVMKAMTEAFGIRAAVAETEPVLEAKSYFLRDVFAAVMIPDQGIAFRSAKAVRRETLRGWVLAGVAGCCALLGLVFPLRAFLLNRELVASTGALVDGVAANLRSAQAGPALADLEPLRERLELLVRYREEGAPLGMRLGLYRGDQLEPAVRRLYAGAVRRLVLDPVFRGDVEEMNAFVRRLEGTDAPPAHAEHARFYDKLKLHLLLTAPRMQGEPAIGEVEQAFIARHVAEAWAARWSASADPGGPALVEKNARLFARLLAEDPALALPRYEDLVQRERRVLARLPMSTLAVERLAAELDDKGYDLTLTTIVGAPIAALRASAAVRGAFTRRGYEDAIKDRLEDPRSLVELWVVAGGGKEGEEIAERELERLRSRYYERYIDEWRRFIESISVQHLELAPLALLQDLSQGEPAPYVRLFRAVGYNARIAGAPAAAAAQAQSGIVERVKKTLQGSAAGRAVTSAVAHATEREERRLGPRDVERALAGFADFGYAPESAVPPGGVPPKLTLPIDVYQEQLAAVREALQVTLDGGDSAALSAAVSKASMQVQALVDVREVGWRPRLKTLLLPPIESAEGFKWAEEVRRTSAKWCAEVALWYGERIAGRYPFDGDSREEAALGEVVAFFRPGSGRLWKFYDESLSRFVQRAGDGFQFVRVGGRSAPFRPELLQFLRRAQEFTSALFPAGTGEPGVALSLRIRPTPRIGAVFLDVDGQHVEYRNGPEEWTRISWPAQGKAPGASLRARAAGGSDETLVRDGDWSVFRLLEAGAVRAEAGTRDFTVAFPMQTLGATITIDFRPARSETPFFGARRGPNARFLEPFRGLTLPLSIGGGPCGDSITDRR